MPAVGFHLVLSIDTQRDEAEVRIAHKWHDDVVGQPPVRAGFHGSGQW